VRLRLRDVDAGITEADDVGAPVPGGVDEQTRVLVDAPAAAVVAEVVDHELWRAECAVRSCLRDVDAGITEADDVRSPVAGGVGQEAGMLVHAPAPGAVAEVVHDELRGAECAVRLRLRDVDAG